MGSKRPAPGLPLGLILLHEACVGCGSTSVPLLQTMVQLCPSPACSLATLLVAWRHCIICHSSINPFFQRLLSLEAWFNNRPFLVFQKEVVIVITSDNDSRTVSNIHCSLRDWVQLPGFKQHYLIQEHSSSPKTPTTRTFLNGAFKSYIYHPIKPHLSTEKANKIPFNSN